jgi:hypothetical protein
LMVCFFMVLVLCPFGALFVLYDYKYNSFSFPRKGV